MSLTAALEAGRQACSPPTWRALAAVLDIAAPNLANVKAGSKKLSAEQVQKLAALIEADAAELWELQELEHVRRKNPFRTGIATLGAMLSAFLVAVLLTGANGLSSSQALKNSAKNAVDALHIVALLRRMTLELGRLFKIAGTRPMAWGC